MASKLQPPWHWFPNLIFVFPNDTDLDRGFIASLREHRLAMKHPTQKTAPTLVAPIATTMTTNIPVTAQVTNSDTLVRIADKVTFSFIPFIAAL